MYIALPLLIIFVAYIFNVFSSVMNIFVYKCLSAPLIISKNYYAKGYELL